MKVAGLFFIIVFALSCSSTVYLKAPANRSRPTISGTDFYKTVTAYNWQLRDSVALATILNGNIPSFLRKMEAIMVFITDTVSKRRISATIYVTPDYLSIGNDTDWARIPLTPMAAQRVADSFGCFLPTKKIVNDIYKAASVKLEPIPMYAYRDSSPTIYQHHLIIEGQRNGRSGLIAGIKKDVVISGKITHDSKTNRVAIYGWHKLDGKPIQPLYTGHVNWYVDYSHGIRLVYRVMKVEGKWMDYIDVLKHPLYRRLLCDDEWCDFFRYEF